MKIHYYIMLLIAALLPFSVELAITNTFRINLPSETLLAFAVILIFIDIFKNPTLIRQLFLENLWITPLIAAFVLTSAFSTHIWISLKFAIVNITSIFVFFVWQKHLIKQRPEFFEKTIVAFSVSMIIVLVFSIFQFWHYHWNPVTIRGIFRPFYKDHTILGAATAFLTVFWIGKSFISKKKWLPVIFSVIFLGALLLSNCRAAILSLLFSGIIWGLLRIKTRISILFFGIFISILVLCFNFDRVHHWLEKNKAESHKFQSNYLSRLESSGNINTDVSNRERLNRWAAGIRMFFDKPVTGFGPGTYQFEYIPFQEPKLMNRLSVKDLSNISVNSGGTAHSEYILVLSEMGILGILSLLLLIGRWVWIAFEGSRLLKNRHIIILAFSILAGYLFHAFFNNFLNSDKIAFLFWGFAAWMISAFEQQTTGHNYGK